MTRTLFALLALSSAAWMAPVTQAQAHKDDQDNKAPTAVPRLLHYQVRLTEPDSAPLVGTVRMAFRLYGGAEEGPVLWSETHDAVPLADGIASVLLGSLVTLPNNIFDGAERYLGLSVNNGEEMTPRLRIGAVPYAIEASRLGGKTSADFEPKGAVLALAINDGTPPNAGTNRIHWNNMVGMPQGFVDGVDDGVTEHGALSGLDDNDHPQYALGSELAATAGQGPNSGKNLVHWENLVGVPSGFADGADNTGAGITVHGDLSGLDKDDHPQYATDDDLNLHAGDTSIHGRTTDAADLTSGFLSPDRIEAGSVDGGKLADNSVGAQDLADEGGVAFQTADVQDSLEALPQDLTSVTLDCPAAGWVLVVGTAQACADSGLALLEASFSVSAASGMLHDPALVFFDLAVDPNGASCLPVASQAVFPVTAGFQSFYLVAKTDAPGARASRYSLSAVFLPTQY